MIKPLCVEALWFPSDGILIAAESALPLDAKPSEVRQFIEFCDPLECVRCSLRFYGVFDRAFDLCPSCRMRN